MSNISTLTSKILKDAEEKKAEILKNAEAEKIKIIEKKLNEAKALETEILEKAKIEAISQKERVISSSKLIARNEKLRAKQEIIEQVFKKSIISLCELNKEQYTSFIKNTILELNIDGDESLILNQQGKKIVDSSLIDEINNKLLSKGKKGKITLSEQVGSFKGGFVLEKDGIEINNTFEALVNSLKEELELQVAKELFN